MGLRLEEKQNCFSGPLGSGTLTLAPTKLDTSVFVHTSGEHISTYHPFDVLQFGIYVCEN